MGRQEQKPLHQCEVSTEWPCSEIEDLHRAARPASTLHEECLEAFRRQSEGQALTQVARDIAVAKQA